jgi:hypothetical protein
LLWRGVLLEAVLLLRVVGEGRHGQAHLLADLLQLSHRLQRVARVERRDLWHLARLREGRRMLT